MSARGPGLGPVAEPETGKGGVCNFTMAFSSGAGGASTSDRRLCSRTMGRPGCGGWVARLSRFPPLTRDLPTTQRVIIIDGIVGGCRPARRPVVCVWQGKLYTVTFRHGAREEKRQLTWLDDGTAGLGLDLGP